MGFLKRITRPISRALDKLVPNEIKPALPFLAAAAPFMAPGIMGAFGNSMLSRGLISGGLNLGSQLAQEGSEGDFSGLSLAMASGIGALSAPGSQIKTMNPSEGVITSGQPSAADYFSGKAVGMDPGFTKSGLGALEGTSNYLAETGETLRNNLFSKEGLKAAILPVGQGITDLAIAQNRRDMKDYERDMADYEESMGDDSDNANRAFAIRQSMEAYGFTEQEILDAISAAGYRAGGRVGLANGGDLGPMGNPAVVTEIDNMREFNIMNPDIEDVTDYSRKYKDNEIEFQDIKETVKEVDKDKVKSDIFGLGDPELVSKVGEDINEGILSLSDVITDKDGSVYLPIQYLRKLGEDMFFGGQKNPELPEKMYDKLSDEYIEEMKKVKERGYKDGGLMNLGGREMDLRGGGFVPIGKKERADDVPARLSKNEFVMTADAVRAAGGGSVNEGAKRMYETMNRLEAKV